MPNISDKLKEFFGDPTIPGQAVEEVLMNAKEMGYGPGGGSGDVFKVTFIYDESTGTTSVDKTYAQIKTAIESSQIVIGVDGESTLTPYEVYDDMTHQAYGIAFTSFTISSHNGQQSSANALIIGYVVKTDDSVEDVYDNINMDN